MCVVNEITDLKDEELVHDNLLYFWLISIFFPPADFKQSCASLAPSWSRALQHPVSTAQQQPRRSTTAWTILSGSSLRKDWSTIWPVSLTAWICPGILIALCCYFFSSDLLVTCGFTQVWLFALYNQCLHHPIFLSPNMANTVNAALKPLETLSRIVNQPSSLFGGKGGSSKNKTEHDTVGTARDSNSNTQDQGMPAEWETCTVIFEVYLFSLKVNISLRGVWRDGTSRGQSQGTGNRQWPHGWRGWGRHCGHCWSARGAKHSGHAGD